MISMKSILILMMLFVFTSVLFCQDNKVKITEASGITRSGDKLLIVSDNVPGVYYEYDIPAYDYDVIPIDPAKTREVKLPGAELAGDLEAIGLTGDGEVIVLSELLHSLIGKKDKNTKQYSIISYYNKSYTEFGNRGLEGMAVKNSSHGGYELAVLWEGGYPIGAIIPEEIRECVDGKSLKPRVLIHSIPGDDTHKPQQFALDTPLPDNESRGQRYRGSAVAWHEYFVGDNRVDCLIVLLQSENCPPEDSDERASYEYKILQKFDLEGNPLGYPIDINEHAKKAMDNLDHIFYESIGIRMAKHMKAAIESLRASDWENVNWEGMGWFEKGKSLVLIYDKHPDDPPFAMILHLPENW